MVAFVSGAGPVALATPAGVGRIDVETAEQMADAVMASLPADAAILVAAAGVLALLKASHPEATPAELVALLRAQADDKSCPTDTRCTGTPAYNGFFGDGLVDALDATAAR